MVPPSWRHLTPAFGSDSPTPNAYRRAKRKCPGGTATIVSSLRATPADRCRQDGGNTEIWYYLLMAIDPYLIDLPDSLEGPRVLLRPYRAGDGLAMFEAVDESRDHLSPWLPWVSGHGSPTDSEATARRCLAQWITREDLTMGMWDRASGRYLGGTGLHRMNWETPSFEIGYWIRKSAEGQGYVTEAVRVLRDFCFDELHAVRLHIRCQRSNVRSAAVPPRVGFELEGVLRNAMKGADGQPVDHLLFSMIPTDPRR